MKQGWESKKLGDVYDVRDGTHDSPKYQDSGFPLITSKNLKDGSITLDKIKYISKIDYLNINKRSKVDIGDILFAMIGTIGNPVVVMKEPDFAIKNVALFKVPEEQSSAFLKYYLEFVTEAMKGDAKGSTQKFVGLGYLRGFEIRLPELQEQKQIVAKLDQCFEAIDKAKANAAKNLENAKELFQSKLNDIFSHKGEGWVEKTLEESCDLITCGVAAKPEYVDESVGVPFLSAQNVVNGEVILHKYKHISKEFHKKLTKKNKPEKGDILYSRVGAKFGEAGVVEHSFEFSVYVSLTLIKPKSELLNSYYLKFYLNSPNVKKIANSSIGSSGVPNLNVKAVRQFPAIFPSLKEQKSIVSFIQTLRKQTQSLESKYQQELNSLEELKKSILQKAFEGEL
jgi:type I restriction enzyme S subunit